MYVRMYVCMYVYMSVCVCMYVLIRIRTCSYNSISNVTFCHVPVVKTAAAADDDDDDDGDDMLGDDVLTKLVKTPKMSLIWLMGK